MTQSKVPPLEKTFRAGTIWAHINAEEQIAGTKFRKHSVRIQRHWRDTREEKWRTTTYFRPEDLPKLILVASKAYEHIMLHEIAPFGDIENEVEGGADVAEDNDGA